MRYNGSVTWIHKVAAAAALCECVCSQFFHFIHFLRFSCCVFCIYEMPTRSVFSALWSSRIRLTHTRFSLFHRTERMNKEQNQTTKTNGECVSVSCVLVCVDVLLIVLCEHYDVIKTDWLTKYMKHSHTHRAQWYEISHTISLVAISSNDCLSICVLLGLELCCFHDFRTLERYT